jgi:type IV pilus assembly protein PilA
LGKRRGFSVIEGMNFLALAAVLAAIGMYALARYGRHAKTSEAQESLTRLAANAADYFNHSDATQPAGAVPAAVHAMRHFPPSSRVAVPEDPLSVRGQKYQSSTADWNVSPWHDLGFSIVQPQCFQYSFESEGAGPTAKALIVAEGDLDGDGTRSKWTLTVAPDATLTAVVSPQIVRTTPEE